MKNKSVLFIIIFATFFLHIGNSQAHQPRIVLGEAGTIVSDPEISKVYFGELDGQANFFTIHKDAPFNLYINALVPDVMGVQKNISVEIRKDGQLIATLDGVNFKWKNFYDPFAGDNYFKGPEYRMSVEPGDYKIKIFNQNETGKYALVFGETESFPASEVFRAFITTPQVKKDFFGESGISAFLNQAVLFFFSIAFAIGGIIWLFTLTYHKKEIIE